MQFLVSNGERSFESGAAVLSTFVVPVVIGILFLPLDKLADGYNQRKNINFQAPSWIFTFMSLPMRFLVGVAIGYGALVGLGGYAPQFYLLVITIVGVLFVMLIGMTTSMLVSILLERVAYRPLRAAPRLAPLISAIGASIFFQQVALRIFGPTPKNYDRISLLNDPKSYSIGLGSLGDLSVSIVGTVIVISSIALMGMLYFIVQYTKMGKAMRAVAEDKPTAALMGIDVDRVIVFTFMLGASLAGAAGVMLGLRGDNINFRFGFTPGLKAFTAAVLGGIGNIPGAMFGGFFLGVVESLGPQMLGFDFKWQDVIAFSLLVLVLIFRPTGILGERTEGKKV
ncbi:MAG: branched-chain amino acid ABC transporter permease [Anaerolineae bacterium]|nr:branched-chain amino acid ABC transporter permease [Anaerolineae bacterium]